MAEKLPIDVIAHVFQLLLNDGAVKCRVCRRPMDFEVRSSDMQSAMLVCRAWRTAWKRMIIRSLNSRPFSFCPNPVQCFLQWHEDLTKYERSLPRAKVFHLLK